MAYTFTPDLVTGNAMIDSQHKELIAAINDLLVACNAGQGRAEITATIDFLEGYTAKHFGDEEQLQQKYGYPDYINHKKYHDTFKSVVNNLGMRLKQEGPNVALVAKVNSEIASWLISHIKREDVKVAMHIKANS
ncbi:MAG: hemerythrin family protein [Ruminococcus sp.]|jgi:hemerythrin|nr:hemerythrin family protein [Ruminococcus sp.]